MAHAIQERIYSYLNIQKLNNNMDDKVFESILPQLVNDLYAYGFDAILHDYNQNLKDSHTDFNALKKKEIQTDYISSTSVVGLCVIKQHMPHIYEVKSHKGTSIIESWTKEYIEKVLRINRKTHSTPYVSEIIRQLGFAAGTSKVTIYRPLLTKRIVDSLGAKRVLDVCVGWGGRMLGSACLDGVHYTGIEPCKKTFDGLTKIKQELHLDDQVTLYHDVAEAVLPQLKGTFDLALTSPPYYNLEIYSNEETQSHQYGTYENWVAHFLKPVVFGVLDHLEDHGYSCWSVKNFKTDKSYTLYDDIVALHREKGWIKIEREFYIGNCLRPGLKDEEGNARKSKESTFVFVKEDHLDFHT